MLVNLYTLIFNSMKQFIIKLLLFFLLLIIIDFTVGYTLTYLSNYAKGGDTARNNYICNQTNEDLLILGSSRAIHHYNAKILKDSLKMSCYNCGQNGNGILLMYGRLLIINKRYKPRLIIYDVQPTFDYLEGEDNHKYLDLLKPYYHREGISELFETVDNTEKYKMLSKMYQYNSKFIQIISDYFHPMAPKDIYGYRPRSGIIEENKIAKQKKVKDLQIDTLKWNYFNKLIDITGEERIIFVASPLWNGIQPKYYAPLKELCQKRKIPFLDFSNDTSFVQKNILFDDAVHLNSNGADKFTNKLIRELKKLNMVVLSVNERDTIKQ